MKTKKIDIGLIKRHEDSGIFTPYFSIDKYTFRLADIYNEKQAVLMVKRLTKALEIISQTEATIEDERLQKLREINRINSEQSKTCDTCNALNSRCSQHDIIQSLNH